LIFEPGASAVDTTHVLQTWIARLGEYGEQPLDPAERAALLCDLEATLQEVPRQRSAEDAITFLSEAGKLLNSSLEVKQTLENVLRIALPRFADWVMIDLFDDQQVLRTYAVQHKDPAMQRFASRMEGRAHFDLNGPGGVPKVVRTGEYDLLEEIPDIVFERGVPDPDDRAMYRAWGTTSALVVPMKTRGRLIGTLAFVVGNHERKYTEAGVPFVQEFANRAALSLDNARLYEREHRVAATLQNAILPERLPRVPGFVFDKTYLPGAAEAEIGGDWYDAFMLPDGRLAVSIGDVGGKGLHAAVLMSEMRHSIRANALDERCSPADVLDRANKLLALSGASLIVTAFFGFLDPVSYTLSYASAGHPGPVLVGPDGQGRILPTDGVPLGVDFAEPPAVFAERLAVGSLLVLYTDGLLEFDRDIIGNERRIVEAARSVLAERPPHMARALERRVLGEAERKDDIALLCVLLDDAPVQAVDVTLPAAGPSAGIVRREVERFAAGVGLSEDTLFALQIAVGEAVINAIEHAYRNRGGELTVRLQRLADGIAASVQDHGAWRAIAHSKEPPLERERGRGFLLMDGFAEDVRVHKTGTGTTVRFVVPLAPPAPGAT
jgi:serine phosphatase RsbU (regulator of sigma subunit)/anti-sigma regulatory factor (Ser/Thr protein kinase)